MTEAEAFETWWLTHARDAVDGPHRAHAKAAWLAAYAAGQQAEQDRCAQLAFEVAHSYRDEVAMTAGHQHGVEAAEAIYGAIRQAPPPASET